MNYQSWIKKFDKATAQAAISKLQAKIDRTMAAGHRSARRHEDAGPLDIASERAQPAVNMVELLTALVQGKKPTQAQVDEFEQHVREKETHQQYKDQRKAAVAKFPSLVGYTIHWKGKYGKPMQGTVLKQRPGKWSDEPKYSVLATDGSKWGVPHSLVTKKEKPANLDQVVKGLVKQKDKLMKKTASLRPGQTVEWNSKRGGGGVRSGKVVRAGRTRVKVDVAGSVWTVPMSLVTKVDGKPV